MTATNLKIVKLTEHAFVPTKGSPQAAGFDLYSPYDYIIKPRGTTLVLTDLQISVPEGTYGRIAPRSSLALKFIQVGGGVIDRDYTGNVGIILFNHSDENFKITRGDRVAQLICEKIVNPDIQICTRLPNTNRGAQGFGSSGK